MDKSWLYLLMSLVLIKNANSDFMSADACTPLLVAHRGASGYVPEHTLGAYALAITMGADYIEPDLVMTKDGHLIARHDNHLGLTTDVSSKTEFANRYRNNTIDGVTTAGWFTEDFTLAEIKTLRAIERIPSIRPGNARMDSAFEVPTFQEIIDLAKSMETIHCRRIGIYPEIKHPSHFQRLGLAMEKPLVDAFHNNGYRGQNAPAFIQSFEITNLKQLKNMTDLRLLQLFGTNPLNRPYDQVLLNTNVTYFSMTTPEGLKDIATYAYGVGPEKSYIITRTVNNTLGPPTRFVEYAHAAGLKVYPWTFRSENTYLPQEFRRGSVESDFGDAEGEIRAFIAAGVDGLFVDQPDALIRVRDPCVSNITTCRSSATYLKPTVLFTFILMFVSVLYKI